MIGRVNTTAVNYPATLATEAVVRFTDFSFHESFSYSAPHKLKTPNVVMLLDHDRDVASARQTTYHIHSRFIPKPMPECPGVSHPTALISPIRTI